MGIDEEAAWGTILADAARHIAKALQDGGNLNETVSLAKLVAKFNDEVSDQEDWRKNRMRPIAAIDADVRTLIESRDWIRKAGHPNQDIQWFREAAARLSIDYDCVAAVVEMGDSWDEIVAYLESASQYLLEPVGSVLSGCNGVRKTCARKAAGTKPYCKACRAL